MPKRGTAQDSGPAAEAPREKRTQRQRGFYSNLLKGGVATAGRNSPLRQGTAARKQRKSDVKQQAVAEEPECDVEVDQRNNRSHLSADGTTLTDGTTHASDPTHTVSTTHADGTTFAEGTTHIASTTCTKDTTHIDGTICAEDTTHIASTTCTTDTIHTTHIDGTICAEDTTHIASTTCTTDTTHTDQVVTSPKTDGVCTRKTLTPPSQGGEGKRKNFTSSTGQVVQKVVAVVLGNMAAQSVREYLLSEGLPRQREEVEVEVEQSACEVTVRGSIEQVQQVLNILAQNGTACAPHHPRESTTAGACGEISSGCGPCDDPPALSEEVRETDSDLQHDQTVVYEYVVGSSDGTSEAPSPPHLSTVTGSHQGTVVTMDTRIAVVQESVQESVIYMNSVELSSPEGELSSGTHNASSGTARRKTSAGLSSSHPGSDRSLKTSPPAELSIPLSTVSSGGQASTSQVREGRFRLREVAEGGSNSAETLPVSLPGLLPLACAVRCGVCDECVNNDCVKSHMEGKHASRDEAYPCDVCGLAYPDKRSLLGHLKTTHEAAGITCQICGKKFQCLRYLRTHLQRHAGVKNFECPECGWRFFERHKLKFHLESHKAEGERCLPYRCHLCAKQFSNKASWSDHCNTHSGHRPFQCAVCGARFGHRVGLRRHKLTHEKVKPFSCAVCSRMFAVKPKLDEHMITHTGVSKHVCPHCHKVFTAASSLKRHATRCPMAAMLGVKQDSNPDPAPDPSGPPDPQDEVPGALFQCGTCCLCFSSYRQAALHAGTHEATVSVSKSVGNVVVTSGTPTSLLSSALTSGTPTSLLPSALTSGTPTSLLSSALTSGTPTSVLTSGTPTSVLPSALTSRRAEQDVAGEEVGQRQRGAGGEGGREGAGREGGREGAESGGTRCIIIQAADSRGAGPAWAGEEGGGQCVTEQGEVTANAAGAGEVIVSVEEMEQIQLAASTLADLSAM